MSWLNLTITAPVHLADSIEAYLMDAGALSVTLSDAGDTPVLEPGPGETPLWPETALTALFPEAMDMAPLVDSLQKNFGINTPPHIVTLPEQDWTRAWMDDFQPMRFGNRLWICPSWSPPPDPDAINLRLDPGLAFGTGTHPTTALCLEWLDQNALSAFNVLDFGCGSGILSIAALMLGAHKATATDIDQQALIATRENAHCNGIQDECLNITFPQALPDQRYDLVIANILSGPLIELAETLCNYLKPGAQILLSGILAEQARDTAAAYEKHIEWEPPVSREGWIRLSGRMRSS